MAYLNILVTLDGSKFAEAEINAVTEIAPPGAHIHLLSVIDKEPLTALMARIYASTDELQTLNESVMLFRTEPPSMLDLRDEYLEAVSDGLDQRKYHVTHEVRVGNVVDSILEAARDGFDVIVMATHNRVGVGKLIVGSVTQSVLLRASCPVLVITPSHNVSQ